MTNPTQPKPPFLQSSFFKAALGTVVVFGIMFLYVFEFAYLQNTFNVFYLIIGSIIIGAIIGFVIGQKQRKKFNDEDEKRVVSVGYPIMIGLLFPLMISLINRKLNFRTPKQETVEFFKFEPYGGSRVGNIGGGSTDIDGYSIFFIRNQNIERIRSKEPHFRDIIQGQEIQIPVSKGLLGFEYVMLPE